MYLNIVVGTLLFALSLGESSNTAVSSMSFHRDDVPFSYEYRSVHLSDNQKTKKDLNSYRNKNGNQLLPQPEYYRHIQYAPLVLSPNEQENLRTLYIQTTVPTELSDTPEREVNTDKNNLEPQFVEQYTGNGNHDKKLIPLQYVGGHNNIKVEPKLNKIVYRNELESGTRNNYKFSDRNTKLFTIKGNINHIHQSYLNELPGKRQDINPHLKYTSVTEHNKPQKHYNNMFNQHLEKPIKHIEVLSDLESAKIQPVFNPYVKAPRLHLNIARGYKIAHGQYKAPGNDHLKSFISKLDTRN